jgi:hypothetical protein
MALGKAFIEVHADTKPFAREIGKEIDKILRDVEKDTRKSGGKLGESVGDGVADGVNRKKKKISSRLGEAFDPKENEGFFSRFSKGIVDALDDGISGLPAEIKVVLGAALLAVAPIAGALVAAAVTAAIVAGLTIGLGVIGIVVAAQFAEVRDEFSALMGDLRNIIVEDGQVLFVPMIAALVMVEDRLMALRPLWQNVFGEAAKIILPLVDALLGFVEEFAPGLTVALGQSHRFVDILADGLREIGAEAGNFLAVIASDDDATAALSEILLFIRDLITFTGALTLAFLDLFGLIRKVAIALDVFGVIQPELEHFQKTGLLSAEAMAKLQAGVRGTATALQAQEDAMKEVNKAINDYIDATVSAFQGTVDFEQKLDDMTEALKIHRGAWNLDTQAGRDHQTAVVAAAKALVVQRANTINLTRDTEAASATFATNTARLRALAIAGGISAAKFDALTGAILSVPPPIAPGINPAAIPPVTSLAAAFRALAAAINAAVAAQSKLRKRTITGGGGGVQEFAEGGIVPATPGGQIVRVGEGGSSETIIPNNDPSRAMQLLNQSGLSSMFTPIVNVFVGNTQLNAFIDSRISEILTMSARDLAYGTRGI